MSSVSASREASGLCMEPGANPDLWFDSTNEARRLCGLCPVMDQCRDDGLSLVRGGDEIHGIWGGLSPIQLRRLAAATDGDPVAFARMNRMRRVRA